MPEIIELPDDEPEQAKPIAEEKFPPGIVFYPFAYALLDDELTNFCWYCLKSPKEEAAVLKKCSRCKVALFCNKTCQCLGWKDHRVECKGLVILRPVIPDVEVRMLGRIVIRAKQIAENLDKEENFYLNRTSRRSVMEIWSHTENMRKSTKAWNLFQRIRESLLRFYGSGNLLDEEKIFELHCRNFINRHAISDENYLKEIGKGLYLDLCAYDHSCRPNSIYVCDGFVATLRALSPSTNIADTSSTFYTYIDLLNSRECRQEMLEDSWYFFCKCSRCTNENDSMLTSIRCHLCSGPVVVTLRSGKTIDLEDKPYKCRSCGSECPRTRIVDGISCMQRIDALVNENDLYKRSKPENLRFVESLLPQVSEILHNANIFIVRLLQAAINNTEQLPENNRQMLAYHLQAEECLRLCYPNNHPALSYHLMNIGIYCFHLGEHNMAKQYLVEALRMLKHTLGSKHSMTLQTVEFLLAL